MKRSILSFIIVIAIFVATLGHAQSKRAIPDDNLAYPVLITLQNGNYGSGFYVNTPTAVYLVTAKHVLFDPATQRPVRP